MGVEEKDIWEERAATFNNISWVTDNDLLRFIYVSSQVKDGNKILCAGIGTGVVAGYFLNQKSDLTVYGIDSSKEMLALINDDRIKVKYGDLKKIPFAEDFFDCVILRSTLHHCVGYTSTVISEAMRVLKPEGKIIICEGMPISEKCVSDFTQIVTVKENRVVFTDENFLQMLRDFKNICAGSIILKQQSIKNWISNCCVDKFLADEIMNRHYNSSELYKELANMNMIDDDIFVDMRFLVVRAEK